MSAVRLAGQTTAPEQPINGSAESNPSPGGNGCFHCGEPLVPGQVWPVQFAGQMQSVCCPGCQAVFEAIHGAGLQAYYEHRQATAVQPDSLSETRDMSDGWSVYDDADSLAQLCTVEDAAPGLPDGARVHRLTLHVDGLRCGACVWLIEQALSGMPGVIGASVNYGNARCQVRFDASQINLSDIIGRIHSLGYGCVPNGAAAQAQAFDRETRSHRQRLFVAGLAMMQAMMFSLPGYLSGPGEIEPAYVSLLRWAGLAVVTPALLFSGWPIFWAALSNLRRRHVSMDTPVSIALLIAFTASLWATLTGDGEVYFDSIAMFLFLLLGARYLERQARRRATQAARDLELMMPEVAERLDGDGVVERVPVNRLQAGDTIRVQQGERLPADAVVISGSSAVDQSLISGESRPVDVGAGDQVAGGAVVYGAPLTLRVTRRQADSTLSLIRELADRGLSEKPAMVRLADWLASRFVVFVLAAALLTGLAWWVLDPSQALPIAVAVMVIACPCALSLATPAALAAATDSLLRARILTTRGHVFQALTRVTDVVLDKTGTLTQGRPDVTEIQVDPALDQEQRATLLSIVGQALSADPHPMAEAIVRALDQPANGAALPKQNQIATSWRVVIDQAQPGAGVCATATSRSGQVYALKIGSAHWCGIKPDVLSDWRQRAADPFEPVSEVFVVSTAMAGTDAGINGSGGKGPCGLVARFSLTDQLRHGAVTAVGRLQARGLTVHLVTGDRLPPAQDVAGKLNIGAVFADVSPAQKARYVKQLQDDGRVVLMVGDGINDAPVLGCADVSVAVGRASSLAKSAADIVCLGNGVSALPSLLNCAQRTNRIVRQNVVWSISYNTCAIPLAAMGLVPPVLAALGMALSSLLVVGNSMRLIGLSDQARLKRPETLADAGSVGPPVLTEV